MGYFGEFGEEQARTESGSWASGTGSPQAPPLCHGHCPPGMLGTRALMPLLRLGTTSAPLPAGLFSVFVRVTWPWQGSPSVRRLGPTLRASSLRCSRPRTCVTCSLVSGADCLLMTGPPGPGEGQAAPLAPGVQKTFIERFLHARHQAELYKHKDEPEVVLIPEKSPGRYRRCQLVEIVMIIQDRPGEVSQ